MGIRLAAAVLAALLGAGCAGTPAPEAGAPPREAGATASAVPTAPDRQDAAVATPSEREPEVTPSGPFGTARVELRPRAGQPVTVAVHVAADQRTRSRGLMGREEVRAGTGMLFLFPEDTEAGFWMMDTLVPLSIAFADGDGRIVRMLDMEPCSEQPCPVYRPEVAYRAALEVPSGWFDDVGVDEGDELGLPDDLPDAR